MAILTTMNKKELNLVKIIHQKATENLIINGDANLEAIVLK